MGEGEHSSMKIDPNVENCVSWFDKNSIWSGCVSGSRICVPTNTVNNHMLPVVTAELSSITSCGTELVVRLTVSPSLTETLITL